MPWSESFPLAVTSTLPDVGEHVIVVGNPLRAGSRPSRMESSRPPGFGGAGAGSCRSRPPFRGVQREAPWCNLRGEVIGVAFLQFTGVQNLNFCISGERVTRLASAAGPPASLAGGTAASGVAGGRQTFCYLDEKGTVRFSDSPAHPRYSYQLISTHDGALDRSRYERWVFDQIGGNPQTSIPRLRDPRQRMNCRMYSGRYSRPSNTMSDLPNMPQEARNHWEKVVNHHLANAYNGAVQKRNRAILQYRMMMDAFQMYAVSRTH